MKISEVILERVGKYEQPFKVYYKDDGWILEQQENHNWSPIINARANCFNERLCAKAKRYTKKMRRKRIAESILNRAELVQNRLTLNFRLSHLPNTLTFSKSTGSMVPRG